MGLSAALRQELFEAAPIPPIYDAGKGVDVLVQLATKLEAEVTVGSAGKLMNFAHQIAPKAV